MKMLKQGQKVKVFQKWTTREDFEDEAVLQQFIKTCYNTNKEGSHAELWWVNFPADKDSSRYMRTVWPGDVIKEGEVSK